MILRTAVCILAALPVFGQMPVRNHGAIETRSVNGALDREFRSILARDPAARWIGYAVPIVEGQHRICNDSYGQNLPKDGPASELLVLFRVEQNRVRRVRMASDDCGFDAGGMRVEWLTGVRAAESVALLSSLTAEDISGVVSAVALHAGPEADTALERFAAQGQPEKMREQATFWMGAARGRRGFEYLRRVVREDASEHIRDKAVFALFVSKETEATDAIIEAAHKDRSAQVRKQALFWLAQKAGKKAAGEIENALVNDPDTQVKKHAVFALSQLKEDGVPKLIEVARTNRNPEVRKQAVFWLGQSGDPRALAFFEEVLK